MKSWCTALCLIGVLAALAHSYPVDDTISEKVQPVRDLDPLPREKRTVGVLRELFPNFSQFVDRAIQMITRLAFRVIGRLVLQGGGLGGGGGGGGDGGSSNEGRISITLPTYPPLPDEDEDEDTEDSSEAESSAATSTQQPDTAGEDENTVAESKISEVRVKREADTETEAEDEEEEEGEDLESEATGDNELDEEGEVDDSEDEEESDEEARNKRLVSFSLGGVGAAPHQPSGNFLFDIIRAMTGGVSTPAAGAGVEAGAAVAVAKEADFGLGVPGPLTRLFVIANRGVANLIQDIILRMAQTSERIVNFKARLITALI